MKKSIIALAVLAASGAAMAQSSVTLYGVADAFIGSTETETNSTGGLRQTVVKSNGVNSSRWGLKGAEDLGGGMKAIFTLESGFNLDDGSAASTTSLFNRQAFVGLQSEFGTVSVGRQYSAYYFLQTATNHNYDAATFNASVSPNAVFSNGLKDYTNRVDNSIAYTSPSFSGFSGAAVYSFGENKNSTVNVNGDATDNVSLHVKYANGPILVGYAYQEEKLAAVAGAQDKNKYNMIAGSYDLGVAKLTGSYNTAKNNTFNDKEYQAGVSVPFGAAAISAGYARSKSERGNVEKTGKGYSVLATYDLSKRTRLYAGAQNTESYAAFTNAASPKTEITTYGLGVRHAF